MKNLDWFTLYQRFVLKYANYHYSMWKKDRKIENGDNPYNRGYSQPQWIREMTKAIGENDEEKVKGIFMVESSYDPDMLKIRKEVTNE
jgi:hypothetical protein